MAVLAIISIGLWACALGLAALGTYLAYKHFEFSKPADLSNELKPPQSKTQAISVLKPLCGVDGDLRANLETFFKLEYDEGYELIFCVAKPEDAAVPIVKELIAQYHAVPAVLVCAPAMVGPNPKINNILHAYNRAQHDWILISDSNVRVPRDYLQKLGREFKPDVGVLTAVVAGRGAESLGGRLESIFLNTFYARWMFLAEFFGNPCTVGKSMLFRRSVADRFGGIQNLGRYLAEDYMAGEAMRYLGLRVAFLSTPIEQHIGTYSVSDFWKRHIRWGRIRKSQAPGVFCIEPLFMFTISGIIGTLGVAYFGNAWREFLLFHFLAWFILDAILIRSLGQRIGFRLPIFWLARELSAIPQWIHIAMGNTVHWRGGRYEVLRGGILRQ